MEENPANSKIARPLPRQSARRIPVRNLLQSASTLILEHRGEDYVLRVTRNGKLILTRWAEPCVETGRREVERKLFEGKKNDI